MLNVYIVQILHPLLAFLCGKVEGYLDQRKKERGGTIEHGKSLKWRLIAALPLVAVLTYNYSMYIELQWIDLAAYYILTIIIDGVMYMIGLNITFNLRDGRAINALGTEAVTDNYLDDQWLKHAVLFVSLLSGLEVSLLLATVSWR